MPALQNFARERLKRGEVCIGGNPHISRAPEIGRIFQACDYDWLYIDLEHSAHTVDSAGDLSLAALDQGITPLVRVGTHNGHMINRVICNGAMGVIVPHVQTADEARHIVDHVKFAPDGKASVPAFFLHYRHAAVDKKSAARDLNAQTLVIPMIESRKAVENAEEIAAVDGVDVLFVGGSDLTFDMGLNGQYGHPEVKAACQSVIDACRQHGKYPGMGGPGDEALLAEYVRMGMRFMSGANDVNLLVSGARAKAAFWRGIL